MHRGSFESVSDNIAFQVASKIFTIALNMLIFHKADKNVLGILNVRLALFATTTLAVSREPFRESCMKNPKDHNWPQVINLLWLAVPCTVFFSIVCHLIWLYWFELPAEQYVSDYTTAIIILGVSCFVESLAEPVYVFSRIFNYVSFRLIVEGIMMIVKTVILAVAVLYHDYYPAYSLIIAGAYGQLAASIIYVVLYWSYFHLEFKKKRKLAENRPANLANGSGSLLLGAHCVAVSLMGINGITEAYVSAAMDLQQLDKNNFFMGLFASIMLIISVLLSKSFGSVGFILANYVNMSCRILYSLWFINDHYRNLPFKPLRGIMPSLYILKYFILAFAATAFSWWKIYPESAVVHFVVGALCGLLVLQAIKFGDYELSNLITGNLQKRFGKQINNVINLVYAFLFRLWRKWHNLHR